MLNVGIKGQAECLVTEKNTAATMGSGALQVYATPAMIALVEKAAWESVQPYLEEARNKQNVEDIYMLLTDVPKEESVVISDGRYAAEVLADGFETQPAEDGSFTLPGVVSRKKQFIPALMTAYQEL